MNEFWDSLSDNKSIFYGKISINEYDILKKIMQSDEKINRDITLKEKTEVIELFNKFNIRQEPELKMWFEQGENYNSNIFGAILKTEKFTPIYNDIRGDRIDTFSWEVEINRAYLLSYSDPRFLAIIGYRRDFDVLVDRVQQIIKSSSQRLNSQSLVGITWTIDEIERLADRYNINMTQVYAKKVRDRSDTLTAASYKAQDVRNVDLYNEIRSFITNVRLLFEEGEIEMDMVGKVRTLKHTTDKEKMEILGKYYRK